MTKAKKRGVKVGARSRPKLTAKVRTKAASRVLDLPALRYRALLLDPCNAEMTSAAYAGIGTGQFRRYRSIWASDGASVEGTYVFQLGTNLLFNATHVAATAGTSYTFGTATAITNAIPAATNLRCLAGCVKVRYIGAEQSRAGTIGMAVVPGQYLQPGAVSFATTDLAKMPMVTRFGEIQHEVKWAPAQADEEFHLANTLEQKATCIVINYRGIPASSLQFEITACYELEATDNGVPLASNIPQSRNTLNHVLQSLGPVSSWAYNTVLAPTIKSVYNAAMSTPITGKFASAVAGGLMAL